MPIRFTCPHCGAESNVAEQFAGQSGPCGRCGRTITIPAFAPSYTAEPERRGMSTGVIVAIVIGAVLVVLLMCGGILAALLLPAVSSARDSARRVQCSNNLHQINIALMQYETEHGAFPPAYSVDKNGKPLLSWRVLLLPYLDQDGLYQQFHLDEPWNSPHNRPLAAQMPAIFRCPSEPNLTGEQTSYVLITGRGTAYEANQPMRMDRLERGASETLFMAESAESGICWTEPRDVDIENLRFGLNAPPGQGLRSGHARAVVVGYADGRVVSLPKDTPPGELRRQVLVKP